MFSQVSVRHSVFSCGGEWVSLVPGPFRGVSGTRSLLGVGMSGVRILLEFFLVA